MYFAPSNLKTWLRVCYTSETIGADHVPRFVCVRMWLIYSNRKLYHKKRSLCWHDTTIFFVIDSLTIFTAQIVHSHIYWGKIHSLADQNVHRLQKMFSTNYHAKATRTVLLDWSFAMGALQ